MVKMKVDLGNKNIMWSVENKERGSISLEMLGDKEEFVPFI